MVLSSTHKGEVHEKNRNRNCGRVVSQMKPPSFASVRATKVLVCAGAVVVLLSWSAPSMASNLSFMKDTPYVHFTEKDHKLFNETLEATLNQEADGETRGWSNPVSGAGGDIKALKTFKRGAVTCRLVSIANKAKGRAASAEYNFCRQASGKWALAN
jgi:surface antigen